MTERVTVEVNGERFTLDVPDGTSDEQIQSFLSQQQGGGVTQMTTAEPSLAEPLTEMGAVAAVRPTAEVAGAVARNVAKVTPGQLAKGITEPLATARNVVQGTVDFLTPKTTAPMPTPGVVTPNDLPIRAVEPTRQMTFGEMARPANLGRGAMALGRGIASLALAPENIIMAPYIMAGYEQDKIRANPNAPGLEFNPYAQTLRGEYATQGAAGAANRRATLNRPNTGYQLTPQEAENVLSSGDQRMINIYGGEDALKKRIRMAAAQRVLGQ